jgi:hypothetical protein
MKLSIPATSSILSFLLFFAATACEDRLEPTRTFVIRKGDHYSSTRVTESLQNNVLEFDAMFDSTAIYDLGDQALQTNKNKLLGFSDSNSLHHENSARFAWQWYGGNLEIYAYCYSNGARVEEYIGAVTIGQRNRYAIRCFPDHYEFRLNNEHVTKIERKNTGEKGLYYMLWPYFGGSVPAPHDITIQIGRIYH